jgi:aspartate aminotransferase
LCNTLLEETGVAILPGIAFNRPPWELSARLAYVDFDGRKALAASQVLPHKEPRSAEFIDTHCGNVVEAARRIAEWSAGKSA